MQIKIESVSLNQYQKKLTELHRSAFPNAIRSTLNDAAFEMKNKQLHTSAASNFKHTRSKTFFKKFSSLEKAKGWNVNEMKSIVGMTNQGQSKVDTALGNMDMHENGGSVKKGNTYLEGARVSKSFGRLARKKAYFNKEKITKVKSKKFFIAAAYRAKERGEQLQYKDLVLEIRSIKKNKKGKIKILSSVISKRRKNIRISPTHFITEAGEKTRRNIHSNFRKNAEYQISKRIKL